ncbi:MAG: hypothetical protein KJ904_12985 [Alphaproteobacteria bacterium]|nr:hypothetical protein [Alphaproteobacteria bacterium]MBU0796518.1 hypothetical protein [Alphaproteobacteria bacterium]MBU0888068.1 hypothetical protein [Alphaproteobacteria bacterium]MBU1811513.1 hypothetical protein [Alphaproteobacteria bacterium]MBU2090852.1 hypothetical protein [Alphaproteobacteria bacterium]
MSLASLFQRPVTGGNARANAYRSELRGIVARYRRHKAVWDPHLAETKGIVRDAVALCPGRNRVVVLGSGPLLDVPLDDLLKTFREVVLVDIVHPMALRLRGLLSRQLHVLAIDLTGIGTQPLSAQRRYEPPSMPPADLVISLNLMSQLPIVPLNLLDKQGVEEEDADRFAKRLIAAHYKWLRNQPGQVCLITDVERIVYDLEGKKVMSFDPTYGIPLPEGGTEWEWAMAPVGEIAADGALHHRVRGYPDLAAALAG